MKSLSALSDSFRHAWRGLRLAFVTERSFRVQLAAALVVVFLILLLPLAMWERELLLVAMAAVLVLELVNSMVERLVDLFKPRLHAYVRDIKDLMAAAVLVASFFSLVVGLLIIGPWLGKFLATL